MPNWLGENNARFSLGFDQSNPETIARDDQFYQERRHLIYQLHSDHYLPGIASKINFDVSYTDGKRNEPDFILLQYNYIGDTLFAFENTLRPTRSYREMDDDLLHAKAAIEIPFHKDMRSLGKMTFGASYLNNRRQNIQSQFVITGVGGTEIEDRNTALDVSRFSAEGRTSFDLYYVNQSTELDRDIGIKQIYAAFAMADYHLTTRLRVMGGARLEYTDLIADIYDYWNRNVPADSPERRNIGGVKAAGAEINQVDVLPSVSFIYNLKERNEFPVNLRMNYFRSLARPSFRELSPIALDDFILQGTVQGNSALETVSINNYDIRLESYFPGNNNVSVSVFYKNFIDHIELIERIPNFFSWANADESYTLGFELEGQYSILQNLVFRANLSLIKSLTTISEPVQVERPMFGQAPYIINGSLTHSLDKIRLQYTVSYNLQGPKIAIVSNENVTPNVFESPRHQIDIKVGKKLGDHFNASISARDLLNMPVRRAFKFDSGFDVLNFDNFRWGTTYSLSITYTL
jgi:outer membrane receptor protein involved in Fe transport